MQRIITVSLIGLLIIAVVTINTGLEVRALFYSYQSEIAALKQQQDANQRDINSLHEQTYYLRELMRNAAKNQIP